MAQGSGVPVFALSSFAVASRFKGSGVQTECLLASGYTARVMCISSKNNMNAKQKLINPLQLMYQPSVWFILSIHKAEHSIFQGGLIIPEEKLWQLE